MNELIIKLFVLFYCVTFFNQTFTHAANSTIESYEPYFLGELGEKWEFPSDHLPIGASISRFHIAFWNILNKNYLGHIEENTQGLRKSAILRDNFPVNEEETLTVREMLVAEQILQMIDHPTHPRSLIALQETHKDVMSFLKSHIPSHWVIVTPPKQPSSQDIFLYDTQIFDFVNLTAVKYTDQLPKTIFTLTLSEKNTGKLFRFVQSHIPGGPNSSEGCAKFSKEVLKQYDHNLTIVLMGDMNQSPGVIEQALKKAAEEENRDQPFRHLPIEYPSHMNTHLQASWIDNFFIYVPENEPEIQASHSPSDMFDALVPVVNLLKEKTF